jgi:hypothetical protein
MSVASKSLHQIAAIFAELVVSLTFVVFISQPVFANATFTRNIKTSIDVISDSRVRVTQIHKLSWDDETRIFPAGKNFLYVYVYPALTTQKVDLNQSISAIKIKSKYGTELSYTKSVQDGAIQLKVPYYQDLTYINSMEFQVAYESSLYIAKEGGITELHYPGLSNDFATTSSKDNDKIDESTTYSLEVKINDSFGNLSFIQPEPVTKTKKGAVTTYSYTSNELTGKSLRITLGNRRYIKFKLLGNTFKTNESSPTFVQDVLVNYIDIALPTQQTGTEFANQAVFYSKIEPYPVSLRTDADGNIIARIPVSATHDGNITIEGYSIITSPNSELPQSIVKSTIDSVPTSFTSYFSGEAQYWQVEAPQIQELALKNIDTNRTIIGTVKKTLGTVSSLLSYQNVDTASSLQRQGALMALSTKKGVCMEYADLMLSILRAQKIPTRTVYGDGVGSRVDRTIEGIGHQWVGVYFPEVGWVSVDPTWSDKGKEYIGPDFDHFVWYVASKSVNDPSGFNCLSWDETSPCREALKIDTEPVNEIPTGLFTISDIRQKLESEKQSQKGSTMVMQKVVSYLGASKLGRLLLSTSGLMLLSALILYIILVNIVAAVGKQIKKRRAVNQPTLTN